VSTIDDALNSPAIAWLPPKITADWRQAGYAGDGSIDDLSEQSGDSYTVNQSLEDAMPDTVTATGNSTASGVLSLPDVIGRNGAILGRAVRTFSGQVTSSDHGDNGGRLDMGVVPTQDGIAAMTATIIWISWRALVNGTGSGAQLIQPPSGYDIIVPQFTDGDLSIVLLARTQSVRIAHESPPAFYFNQQVNWMCGWMSFQLQQKGSIGWLPAQINSASVRRTGAYATNHSSNFIAVGSTGNSGGIPMGIFLSYGAGETWSQSLGGFQLSGSTASGKQNYAFAVNGPLGLASSYGPGGPGTYQVSANTATPSGPSLQTLDGTFESGVAGWGISNGTLAQSSAQSHGGSNSGLLTTTGTPTQTTFRSGFITVNAGGTFRGWAWARAAASTPNITFSVDWYDASSTLLSTSTSGTITLAANTWTRLDTGAITAPAGAAFAKYGGTMLGNPPAGRAVFWDDVDFRGAETLVVSFSLEAAEFPDMDARKYFSPYNTTSPIYSLDRDVAPMTVSQGLLTEDGPQYQTIFNGQMSSTAISGRTADIEGVSAARLAMMKSVQLPMINGQTAGGNMTWPVTHLLASCGFYASPAPTPFARYWSTFHGSLMYNMGAPPTGQPTPTVVTRYSDADVAAAGGGIGQIDNYQSSDVPGPFQLGMYASSAPTFGQLNQVIFRPYNGWWGSPADYRPAATYGAAGYWDAFSQANSTGRFSCWVRGDQVTVNPTHWGIAQHPGVIGATVALRIMNKDASATEICAVEVGLTMSATPYMYVIMRDNSGNNTIVSSLEPLPIDGNWHFCSWSWNFATGKATARMDTATSTEVSFTTDPTDLPATEAAWDSAGGALSCELGAFLPIAEACLEFGPSVYTAPYIWDPTIGFSPTAIVRPVSYHLNAIVEPAPSAAWDLMVRFAQATMSMYRCDEDDLPNFLPISYFGEPLLTNFASDEWLRSLPTTWGTADLGGDWTLSAGTWSTNISPTYGGIGHMTLATAGTAQTAMLLSVSEQDFDIRTVFVPRNNAAGAQIRADVLARYVDSTHYIAFSLRFQTDLTCDVYIVQNSGSGEVVLGSNISTALTYNGGQFIHIRAKAVSGMLYMKTWNINNIEPAAWTLVTEDLNPQFGAIGLRAQADTGNTNVPWEVWWQHLTAANQYIETIDTETNAQDLDITTDPSKIRNDVTIQFSDTTVATNPAQVIGYGTVMSIPNKKSSTVFSLDTTQAQTLANPVLANLTSSQVSGGTFPAGSHWASFNTKSDGTGTYLAAGSGGIDAVVSAVTPTSVTVSFNNRTGKTAYMTNNNSTGIPFMSILGYVVTSAAGYTTVTDQPSIARRGDRTVSAEVDDIQRREDATSFATQLASICANPRGSVNVHVIGKPSRAPGQLVRIADAQGTGADGLWMILQIQHNKAGAEFTQDLTMVQVLPTAIWDVSNWDESAWGE